VLLVEHLHHDRGRRQREAEAKDRARRRWTARDPDRESDDERADHHLRQADAQHIAPQLPQPLQRQFEPEQEEHDDNAEFGQRIDPLRLVEGDVVRPGVIGDETG